MSWMWYVVGYFLIGAVIAGFRCEMLEAEYHERFRDRGKEHAQKELGGLFGTYLFLWPLELAGLVGTVMAKPFATKAETKDEP